MFGRRGGAAADVPLQIVTQQLVTRARIANVRAGRILLFTFRFLFSLADASGYEV
jgi:hypothetical protein